MHRNLQAIANSTYDVLIIGGGIYGACVAWEATLRGLSVALVDQADFGGATSANSLKIIHGGLRYLQHADFKRMRESIHERTTLMRIAPHLVHPLPVMIPTYGHGMKGKEALRVAMALNDLISCDRNRLEDRQKHIPPGRILSKEECLRRLPGIPEERLTGAALFYDAQVYNSERLTLAFIRSAEQAGAAVANYVEVTGFIHRDGIAGVQAKDVLTDSSFEIRAKTTINTSGPWLNRVLRLLGQPQPPQRLARAMNIVTRPLFNDAVGLSSQGRFLFIVPWRGYSIIGTDYAPWRGKPEVTITERDLQTFLDQINRACPSLNLTREDVSLVHAGLLPSSGLTPTGEPLLSKHYQLYDHAQDGFSGLVSVAGVKYTTARDVAQKVIDYVFKSWGQKPPRSRSSVQPLHGGIGESSRLIANPPFGLNEPIMRRLVYNYGSAYRDVLKYLPPDSDRPGQDLLKAETIHAVREEMAQKLSDVVFRRTELGTARYPGDDVLAACAQTMGAELGWSLTKIEQEQQEVQNHERFKKQAAVQQSIKSPM